MNSFYEPQFTIGTVSQKVGVPAPTIRQWYARKTWTIGNHDREAEADGLARLFSAPTAIGFVITKALSDVGIPATRAAQAAMRFSHVSAEDGRLPGKLFPNDETWLVLWGDYDAVLNLNDDNHHKRIREAFPTSVGTPPLVELQLDELAKRAVEALGFERDILRGES